jgi:hypothetical protein
MTTRHNNMGFMRYVTAGETKTAASQQELPDIVNKLKGGGNPTNGFLYAFTE